MSGHERTVDSDVVVDLAVPSADSSANVTTPDVVGNKSDTVAGTSVIALVKQTLAKTLGSANIAVSTADSVDNVDIVDVVGNKTDTVAGTSLVSYVKGVLAGLLVVAKNSVGNTNIADVIGNKTDDEDGDSAYSKLYILGHHAHGIQLCKPTLAGGITVTSGAGAWGLSASYVVVFATNEITSKFDIHQIHVGSFSASDIYQLELYSGANGAEVLIAQVRFSRTSNTNPGSILPCITPLIPANTQVKARLASAGGGTNVSFSVMYHVY